MRHLPLLIVSLLITVSCKHYTQKETTNYPYFNKTISDTSSTETLIAITDEAYLQYGARIAFVNEKGDTIIPFGKYAFFGTDTLKHYANVIEYVNDSTYGRYIAIDRNQNILYDIVLFDNGPDDFNEGLVRVLRNGKMGFANEYGRVVIPCEYDFAKWFKNGKASVTYKAKEYLDLDEHRRVESDEWFEIDKNGQAIR